jgi:hypothetical protein
VPHHRARAVANLERHESLTAAEGADVSRPADVSMLSRGSQSLRTRLGPMVGIVIDDPPSPKPPTEVSIKLCDLPEGVAAKLAQFDFDQDGAPRASVANSDPNPSAHCVC